jgi:ribonuclease Z
MARLFKWVLILAVVAGVLAGGAYFALQVPAVQDAVIARAVQAQIGRDGGYLVKDDALRVAFCGTSSPLGSDPRSAKSCTMVIAGGKIYVVDIGPEATEVINAWRVPMDRVAGVFLTHFHSDHIGELGEFNMQSWGQGRAAPLNVYGPPGVERVVNGFMEAYALDQTYRTAHHGADLMNAENWRMIPRAVDFDGAAEAGARKAVALQDGELTVTAIEVDHAPVAPAYAYRFDYKGRSVMISGDTKKHAGLAEASKGADVLVHEAQAPHLVHLISDAAKAAGNARLVKIFSDILNYHTTAVEAAEIANAAGVKLLVMTHFAPPISNPIARWAFPRGVDAVRPKGWIMAEDRMLLTLPFGNGTIEVGRVH